MEINPRQNIQREFFDTKFTLNSLSGDDFYMVMLTVENQTFYLVAIGCKTTLVLFTGQGCLLPNITTP